VPTLSWSDYAKRWSKLHGGFDPQTASPFVRGWLFLSYRASRHLARTGIGPNTVTVIGLILSVGVPITGHTWPLVGALLVLVSALADTADGALALITGRTSRLGRVLDSVADRLSEACWALAMLLLGVPVWLAVAAGGLAWLHEYVRARATVAGMHDVGTVTVAERPTRIIVVVVGLAAAVVTTWAATVATAIWAVLGLIGLIQLAVAVRKALRGADPVGDELGRQHDER
jgi:CDP-diacylglycerol--glycerol-3-phosphate 3-phosphatidyltransferase